MTDFTEQECVEIMRRCPRWNKCSVPICPLDLNQSARVKLPGEEKCTLAKSIRTRIGRDTSLPMQGMTSREWSASQRYAQLSDDARKKSNSNKHTATYA